MAKKDTDIRIGGRFWSTSVDSKIIDASQIDGQIDARQIKDLDTIIDSKLDSIVGNAPETLDTLAELSAALNNNKDIFSLYYTKADVYTKSEIDNLLENFEGSGNISGEIAGEDDINDLFK